MIKLLKYVISILVLLSGIFFGTYAFKTVSYGLEGENWSSASTTVEKPYTQVDWAIFNILLSLFLTILGIQLIRTVNED